MRARAQGEGEHWEVGASSRGARGTAPMTRHASRRACCGRLGRRPEGLLTLYRGAWDPSMMGTPRHRQHEGSGRKKVKEGGNDLASRLEWRASLVMG
jgi:hypothetical protein